MRSKKNREVNIFSASVVDLFASGLGVFLIVSIIALVNQKKESSKANFEKAEESFDILGDKKTAEMMDKLKKLEKELFALKIKNLKNPAIGNGTQKETELKIEFEYEKSKMIQKNDILVKQVAKLKSEAKEKNKKITELNYNLKKQSEIKSDEGRNLKSNFSQYEIGSKIRLENVQFYPGTERSIEPYASREIKEFSLYMKANPRVMVEVSGHIFETKKAIDEGKAEDEYNLSGARAKTVCSILEGFGIAKKRLRCIGYGAQRSIYLTNDQYSEQAQKNRRVEIEILSK